MRWFTWVLVWLNIKMTKRTLRSAIRKGNSVAICEGGRKLLYVAISAYKYPTIWTSDLVSECERLLTDAAAATVGTPEETNCAPRPKKFRETIEGLSDTRSTLDAIYARAKVA